MLTLLLALFVSGFASAQSNGILPTLDDYFGRADEVVIGRVVKVETAAEPESFSADRHYRYKYRLSRATVKVEKGVYNASRGDKTVYFASAVLLDPKRLFDAPPRGAKDYIWKNAIQHFQGAGLPLSLVEGERVLLFLYRVSSTRYEFQLPGIPAAAKDDPKAFVVYAGLGEDYPAGGGKQLAPRSGYGGKFHVDGKSFLTGGALRLVERPDGELEVHGSDSWLFPRPPDGAGSRADWLWLLEHRDDPPAAVALVALERYLAGRNAQFAARPRIAVEKAAFWRSFGRGRGEPPVLVKAYARFVNPGPKPLAFRVVKAEAVTEKGRYPLTLQFGSWGGPVWDGRLGPAQEREVQLPGSYAFDGAPSAKLEITLADSEGKEVSWTSPSVTIISAY